jgi:hypothetical protein
MCFLDKEKLFLPEHIGPAVNTSAIFSIFRRVRGRTRATSSRCLTASASFAARAAVVCR